MFNLNRLFLIACAMRCFVLVSARAIPPGIPSYVKDFAPLVYLHSKEQFQPADIGDILKNTVPKYRGGNVNGAPYPLTLDNLDSLNNLGGRDVFLTSRDDISKPSGWFKGGTSDAVNTAIVIVPHNDDIIDVFYFFWYAYNDGGKVMNFLNMGNHVGDWEHVMVRFRSYQPQYMWLSQHAGGELYNFKTLEKTGTRAVVYSALGSHAHYARAGFHDHTIPNLNLPWKGVLTDYTDKGRAFDPLSSAYYYLFDTSSNKFYPYGSAPTAWLDFNGHWGDDTLPDKDKRQFNIFGQKRYTSGPTGPRDKQLWRDKDRVCPQNGQPCTVQPFLGA